MFVSDLNVDRGQLADLCERFGVTRLEVFGSFAQGTAGEDSDVDVLVTFGAGESQGLQFFELEARLADILGRDVDLHERASIEKSPNKYFRRFALEQVEELYAA